MAEFRIIGQRVVKWFAIILGSLVLLLILALALLQTDYGQFIAKKQAEKYLQNKLQTRLSVGSLKINFLSGIHLSHLYLEDRQQKELISVKQLDILYNFSALFRKYIILSDISLKGVSIHLGRDSSSSTFNYDFITEAFASRDTTKAEQEATGFSIHLGKISLDSIHFIMNDKFGGQQYDVSLLKFRSDLSSSDLDKLHFKAGYVLTDGLNCSFILIETGKTEERIIDTLDATAPMRFMADSVSIINTVFRFRNESDQTEIRTTAGIFFARMVDYNPGMLTVSAGLLALKDHSTEVNFKSFKTAKEEKKEVKVETPAAFSFFVDSLSFERNHFRYNDNTYPEIKTKSLDYSHIGIDDLNLHASALGYNGKMYTGIVHDLSLSESGGLRVQQLRGGFHYSDSVIRLKQVYLKTQKNQLDIDASVMVIPGNKPSAKNYRITAVMSSPAIHLDEVLYFQPELARNKYFTPLVNKSIQVSTSMNGTLDNLHIPQVTIREGTNRISASADVLNLPDTKKMIINLRLKEFSSTRNGILSFLPKGTIPDSLLHYIPEKLSLKGTYKGSLENMYADLQLVSSDGNVRVKGTLKNPTEQKAAVYDLSVTTNNLDLKKLLEDTTLGMVSATVIIKGKGFDIKTAEADYDVKVEEAYYHGYTFRNLDVNGKVDNNSIVANLDSRDPNLDVNGNLIFNMNPGHRSIKANAGIDHIDLRKLGFTTDSIDLKGNITADFPLLDTNGIQGKLIMSDTYLGYGSKHYAMDTIQLDAVKNADSQLLRLTSPIADIALSGQYRVQDIGPAIKTVADNYLSVTATDTVFTTKVKADLTAYIHVPDSIISIIPGLDSVAPFYITGKVDTEEDLLTFHATIPKVRYGSMEIDTVSMGVVTREDSLKYDDMRFALSFSKLTGPSYEVKQTYLNGGIRRGVMTGQLAFLDDASKPRYQVPFIYTNDPDRPNISIGDSLMIDRKYWGVSKDNKIYINARQMAGSRISLQNNGTLLEMKASEENAEGLPLQFNISQFRIREIADILIADTALANGMVNGHFNITSLTPFNFTTNITIDSLEVMRAKLGNLKVDVEQKDSGVFVINSSLKGQHNDLSLDGHFVGAGLGGDLKLDIKSFDLSGIEPISSIYFGDLNGILRGNLGIRGTLDKPEIRGVLTSDSLQAIYAMTGTYFKIPRASWTFDEQGIRFDQLNIFDSAGHEGKISGFIQTADYRDINFNLAVEMDNFEVIGRKKFPKQDIYGPTNADVKLTLKGNQKSAIVEGSVKVKDKSSFTYVYRPSTYDQLGEGLVEFFDPSNPLDTTAGKKIGKSSLGFQLQTNLYISITPESTVEIMLDEISGDHLNLKGNAELNLIMKPGGDMSLTGAYLLDGGDYELSLAGLIRKKFKIEKGSSINWYGDPLKGVMNITALYETRTSAGELVNDIDHIPGIDKQKFNFLVYILLKNELLTPDISFRLAMEEKDQDAFDGVIHNRINQINSIPAELNKQVMGLLAFNKFIAENPFNSFTSSGGSYQTQAFNTAGALMTQELTDMVGKYVKDVDIEFGLEQENNYLSGQEIQRTNLDVGISKSLADNRLNVYVGSSFALAGASQDEKALEGLAGDVTLEYMLTSDGKYRLKGYRLTENDMSFQGNIVRTGVSFVVVLEFNRFKNAFKSTKKKKS